MLHTQVEELRLLERNLRSRMNEVGLVEELGLGSRDFERIKRLLQGCATTRNPADRLAIFRQYYPCTFTAFCVLVGTYRYGAENADNGEGMYWGYVWDELGVAFDNAGSGRVVEGVIRKCGLRLFSPHSRGRRYVDLILFHGGIPKACLINYFERVLEPARQAFGLNTVSGGDVLAWIRERGIEGNLLAPVRRYLFHAGDVASDFIERSLDLHTRTSEGAFSTHTLEELAKEVGLHIRVVNAYRVWANSRQQVGTSVQAAETLRRPVLRFNTVLGLPQIILPSQTVPGHRSGSWKLLDGGHLLTQIKVESWRSGSSWATQRHVVTLPKPARTYEIRLDIGDIASRWRIPGFSDAYPFMTFWGKDGSLLDASSGMPRDNIWVVLPSKNVIKDNVVEQKDHYDEKWRGYVAQFISFQRFGLVQEAVHFGDKKVWLLAQGDTRPYLSETYVRDAWIDGFPAFSVAPTLYLPKARKDEKLSQWHISIAGVEVNLEQVKESDSGWALSLVDVEIPMRKPFTLYVRGPLGRSARFSLVVWPEFTFKVAEKVIWPKEDGSASEATLFLQLGANTKLGDTDQFVVSGDPAGLLTLTSRDDARYATLVVQDEVSQEEHTIGLVIPRLRWQLFDAQQEYASPHAMTGGKLALQGIWLRDAQYPRLALDIPQAVTAEAEVYAELGPEHRVYCSPTGRDSKVFDLSTLRQPLANSSKAKLWVQLGVSRACIGGYVARLGLAGLTFYAQPVAPTAYSIHARWSEGRLFNGSVVRLWSLWQPWTPHVEVPVLYFDANSLVSDLVELLPGAYLAEIRVEDPWVPEEPIRPSAGAPDTSTLVVGSDVDRLTFLSQQDGVRGHLTQYLAANDRVTRIESWRHACSSVLPEDLSLLLNYVGQGGSDSLTSTLRQLLEIDGLRHLEIQVSHDRGGFLRHISHSFSDTDLLSVLTVLGYLDSPPDLWSVEQGIEATPLLSILALPYDALRRNKGDYLQACHAVELPDEDDENMFDSKDQVLIDTYVGEKQESWVVHLSENSIKQLIDDINLVPGGVLSKCSLQSSVSQWLLDRLSNIDNSDEFSTNINQIENLLSGIKTRIPSELRRIFGFLSRRKNVLSFYGDNPRWLNVPYGVGLVALLLRSRSVLVDEPQVIEPIRRRILGWALQAAECAPALLAHDLAWIHLTLIHQDNAHATAS